MPTNEIITLQFGHYANFVGAHWWNIQESTFIYNTEKAPEIDFDVLYREGENVNREVTYTPRLLLTDLKGSLHTLRETSELYENIDNPLDQIANDNAEIQMAPKCEKNEFLKKLEEQEGCMHTESIPDEECTFGQFQLGNKVEVWSDYLAARFHPRTLNMIEEYQHNDEGTKFDMFGQGRNIWQNDNFSESWSDHCRAYAEECDYLQGFQMLLDCADGFGGLSCAALEYLEDEYAGKWATAFVTMTPHYAYNGCLGMRTINTAFTFAALAEHASAFVPLCVTEDWRDPETARTFQHLKYDLNKPYNTSAILAAFLDTASCPYRLRNAGRAHNWQKLTVGGRTMVSAALRFPFPMRPLSSVLESFEALADGATLWTNLTPGLRDNGYSVSDACEITFRGLTRESLLPRSRKLDAKNPVYRCGTVQEMAHYFFEYHCDGWSLDNRILSLDTPLKIPPSYPDFFVDHVTRLGYVTDDMLAVAFSVVESPIAAGLYNSTNNGVLLQNLHDNANKIKFNQFPQIAASGIEKLDYEESLEKLLVLYDNYM